MQQTQKYPSSTSKTGQFGLLLAVLLLVICATPVLAEDSRSIAHSNSVTIAKEAVSGSRYKKITGTLMSKADMFAVVNVLKDIDACAQWLHTCIQGSIKENKTPTEVVYHTVIKGPLFIKDREFFVRSAINYDPAREHIYITMEGLNDYEPRQKSPVRVLDLTGHWELQKQSDGDLSITFSMHSNPQTKAAGPSNVLMAKLVAKTISNVDRLAQSAKYMAGVGETQRLILESAVASPTTNREAN